MTDLRLLHFTSVELAFLARIAGTVAGGTTSGKLLFGAEVSDAVMLSGFGGLRLRGWAKASGEGLELDPVIEGVAEVFSSAHEWIQLGFLAGEQASSVLLVSGRTLGVVVTPVEAGVLEVAALDATASSRSIAREFIEQFMASANPGTVTVTVESDRDGTVRSSAAQNLGGDWSFQAAEGTAADPTGREEHIGADSVRARFANWLSLSAS